MERNDQAAKDKVMELIKDIPIAMLSTRGPDGKFHSRPMATSDTAFDGKLYFLTDIESGKTHDLEPEAGGAGAARSAWTRLLTPTTVPGQRGPGFRRAARTTRASR